MTYRTYLVVLVAVVGAAQFTAALQRSWAERTVRSVALGAAPSPDPVPAWGGGLAGTVAAGGVEAPLLVPPPAPTLPPMRQGDRCDTVWTTADTCVEPLAVVPAPEVTYGVSRMPGYAD